MNSTSERDDRLIGSPNAAQDLYGLGVRIGLYLQAIGMLLTVLRATRPRTGIHLAVGTISLSLLSCWAVMSARKEFSPCEAYLELVLISISMGPASMTPVLSESAVSQAMGFCYFLVARFCSTFWTYWFFYNTSHFLPALGTMNVTFFFGKVDITGWFPYFMIGFYSVKLSLEVCLTMARFVVLWFSRRIYWQDDSKLDEVKRQAIDWDRVWAPIFSLPNSILPRPFDSLIAIGQFIFAVTTVETTIAWNQLSPSTDLSSPGQLIPFITGISVFVDGLLNVLRPRWRRICEKDVSASTPEENIAKDNVKLRRRSRAWSV